MIEVFFGWPKGVKDSQNSHNSKTIWLPNYLNKIQRSAMFKGDFEIPLIQINIYHHSTHDYFLSLRGISRNQSELLQSVPSAIFQFTFPRMSGQTLGSARSTVVLSRVGSCLLMPCARARAREGSRNPSTPEIWSISGHLHCFRLVLMRILPFTRSTALLVKHASQGWKGGWLTGRIRVVWRTSQEGRGRISEFFNNRNSRVCS